MADHTITAANWPLNAPPVKATEANNAFHPNSPYQPHNGYKGEIDHRKRYILTLIATIVTALSSTLSALLYGFVGQRLKNSGWLFVTWFVVSAGAFAMLAVACPMMYHQYLVSKGERVDGENGTPLEAIGRGNGSGAQQLNTTVMPERRVPASNSNRHFTTFASLISALGKDDQHDLPTPPATPPRSKEPTETTSTCTSLNNTQQAFPFDHLEIRGRMPGQDYSPPRAKTNHSKDNTVPSTHAVTPNTSPEDKYPTPSSSSVVTVVPPRFPSPVRLRGQRSTAATPVPADSNGPFANDGSPESQASKKAEQDKVARTDSLKKLREATLRRMKAFEQL